MPSSLSPSQSDCLITPQCCDSHLTSRQTSASRKLDNQHPVSILSISFPLKVDIDPHPHRHTQPDKHSHTHPHPGSLYKPVETVYNMSSKLLSLFPLCMSWKINITSKDHIKGLTVKASCHCQCMCRLLVHAFWAKETSAVRGSRQWMQDVLEKLLLFTGCDLQPSTWHSDHDRLAEWNNIPGAQ